MNLELEVFVNDPFEASLLKPLFTDPIDSKLSSPFTKFPFDEKEWTDLMNGDSENCSLIFQIAGEVVGHTSFLFRDELLFLCYVMLIPKYRGLSVAQDMITQSEEFCRLNYPHDELYLHVNKANVRAKKLYEKMGYITCEEFEDKLRMKKKL